MNYGIAGLLMIVGGAGFLIGQENASVEIVQPTERDAAMIIHGQNARLIGLECGDRLATVVAEHEDEFPDGCREIRLLRDSPPLA